MEVGFLFKMQLFLMKNDDFRGEKSHKGGGVGLATWEFFPTFSRFFASLGWVGEFQISHLCQLLLLVSWVNPANPVNPVNLANPARSALWSIFSILPALSILPILLILQILSSPFWRRDKIFVDKSGDYFFFQFSP